MDHLIVRYMTRSGLPNPQDVDGWVRCGLMLKGVVSGGTTIVIGGRTRMELVIIHNEKMVKMWVEIVLRKMQIFGM